MPAEAGAGGCTGATPATGSLPGRAVHIHASAGLAGERDEAALTDREIDWINGLEGALQVGSSTGGFAVPNRAVALASGSAGGGVSG